MVDLLRKRVNSPADGLGLQLQQQLFLVLQQTATRLEWQLFLGSPACWPPPSDRGLAKTPQLSAPIYQNKSVYIYAPPIGSDSLENLDQHNTKLYSESHCPSPQDFAY